MNKAIAKSEPNDLIDLPKAEPIGINPLVQAALSQDINPKKLDKLLSVQKDYEANEARKAFNSAFTAAQNEFPAVLKSAKSHNADYAPYDKIVAAIRPILQKFGLSFRHEIDSKDSITVTCILAHRDGHSESAALTANPDTSGSKNAIQATGSSVTYLKRYTLEAVTGIVTTNDDTDGNLLAKVIDGNQIASINDILGELPDNTLENMLKWLKIDSLADVPESRFLEVIRKLEMKRKQS